MSAPLRAYKNQKVGDMTFTHTFNVFVDNFVVTYKLLFYRVIVLLISLCLYTAVIFPFISRISDTTQVVELSDAFKSFGSAFVNLDFAAMQAEWNAIREAFTNLLELLGSMVGSVVLTVVILLIVFLVQKFFLGLGNYTAGCLVNDRMAMHANTSFIGALIKNLGKSALYNAIYVPLSTLYDIIIFAVMILVTWGLMKIGTPILLLILLFATVIAFLYVIKMTYTSDWLPAIVNGKTTNRAAIAYSFNYRAKGKNFADVLSNYVVLVLMVFAFNVAAVLLTLGAGLFLTLPSSYLIVICFEFVNYCDNNDVKYFMDKNTIVKPEREPKMTRERFFKGDDEQ